MKFCREVHQWKDKKVPTVWNWKRVATILIQRAYIWNKWMEPCYEEDSTYVWKRKWYVEKKECRSPFGKRITWWWKKASTLFWVNGYFRRKRKRDVVFKEELRWHMRYIGCILEGIERMGILRRKNGNFSNHLKKDIQ